MKDKWFTDLKESIEDWEKEGVKILQTDLETIKKCVELIEDLESMYFHELKRSGDLMEKLGKL